jgi:hypothetical protein
MARLGITAAACALAAGAAAQEAGEATTLPTLSIEAQGNEGFYGEVFATTAAGVMRTDTPILETPRSVSVVTQQQMQDRGVRSLVEALQYTPGVTAGSFGNDNRGDWTFVRGFEPTIFLDGMQSFFGYYNNVRPEPFLLSSVQVLKGPSAMLYGNGGAGGIVNESSKLPDPSAPSLVERGIRRDAVRPGRKARPAVELVHLAGDCDEGLLRSVECVVRVVQDPAAHGVHERRVPAKQFVERARVAACGRPSQFVVASSVLPHPSRTTPPGRSRRCP